jgi:hypothetical protein
VKPEERSININTGLQFKVAEAMIEKLGDQPAS